MQKEQLDIIKNRLLRYIEEIYNNTGIYTIISIQGGMEKAALAGTMSNEFNSKDVVGYYIEMVNPKGVILKSGNKGMLLEEICCTIDMMLSSYENTTNSKMGMKYYKCVSTVPRVNDIVNNGEKCLLDKELLV